MKVYIAQLLCPSRHCFIAVAGQFETPEEAKELYIRLGEATGTFKQSYPDVNLKCSICGSGDFSIDLQPTHFETMVEARPELIRLQAQQIVTSEYFRSLRN